MKFLRDDYSAIKRIILLLLGLPIECQGFNARASNWAIQREQIELATTSLMIDIVAQGNNPMESVGSKEPASIDQVDSKLGVKQSKIAYSSLNISVTTQIFYWREKFLIRLERIVVIYDRKNTSVIIAQVNQLWTFYNQVSMAFQTVSLKVLDNVC